MQHDIGLSNPDIQKWIADRIHSRRDRKIMRLRWVDGLTLEQIAEIVALSPCQVQRIVSQYTKMIQK